ncbi:hypothetical protein AB0M28_24165 [Streptomyces sp. NPDC051940]|uniref:hypothetical protein n=1 Tax=Streptomyces sp. NPDC051940 TaxID=3155675 RepID=UPI0034379099
MFHDVDSAYGETWAVGPGDVWAAGSLYREDTAGGYDSGHALLLHYDGTTWSEVQLPLPAEESYSRLTAVAVAADGTVWTGGIRASAGSSEEAFVQRRDPAGGWRQAAGGASPGWVSELQALPGSEALAVGETQNPAVDPDGDYVLTLGADGAFVRAEDPPGAGSLYGAATDAEGRVWAVGAGGRSRLVPDGLRGRPRLTYHPPPRGHGLRGGSGGRRRSGTPL